MKGFFTICMLLALACVATALIIGLVAMAKGGEFNRKWGNKIMRARLALQLAALAFFVLAMTLGLNHD